MKLLILRVPDDAPDSYHGGAQADHADNDADAIRKARNHHDAFGFHYIVVDGLVTVFDTRAPDRGAIA